MKHEVVSPAQWEQARKALLLKEKELTRARDALSQARRELPWERVEKSYVFDGPSGEESLADLAGSLSAIGVGAAGAAAFAPIARPLALAAAAGSILWVLVQQFRAVTKKCRGRVDPRADGSSCSRKAGRYRSQGDDDLCASC